MEPLRILHVMRAPVGGLFRHVSDLTMELAARGHQVGIVADSASGDSLTESRLSALGAHAALGVHRLPIPRLLGLHDLSTPQTLRRLAKELDIAVLHGHGAKGGFGARLASMGSSNPVALYTPHGGALHFDQRKPAGAVFMAIERLLLRATDGLIFESAHAQRVFAEKVASPKCRQAVIHNGLCEEEFAAVEPDAGAADFVFIGELRMLKGIDLLIEALAPLKRPDGRAATLVMAGDGPDAQYLRDKIVAMGLDKRVSLAGVQPASEMFARGRCVVVPSRAESLPYIVLEAAAACRPLIATRVGGIPEIFGPGEGRLIPPDDASALRNAMAGFLQEPAAFETDAAARQDFIHTRFSVSRMTGEIEAFYRSLLTRA